MTLRTLLDGLAEVRGALVADASGRVVEASGGASERDAAVAAATLGELASVGRAVGLARLELLLVRGGSAATVTASRPERFVLARVDASKGTAQVEKALHAWAAGDGAAGPERPAAATAGPRTPPPLPSVQRATPAAGSPRPAPAARATPAPSGATALPAAPASGAAREAGDPWAAFRRALVRGALGEAAAHRRRLGQAAAGPVRPGGEPLAPAELEGALQALLQGIGSVLAGDGVAGVRALEPLTAETHGNLSIRWAALLWTARAALRSGNSPDARTNLTQALMLAKRLDGEALAASQWIAGELLAHDGDATRALACLAAARAGYERLRDGWGLGQTRLAEARVLVTLEREEDAFAAAGQAMAASPGWEDPAVFLARRALLKNDLAAAESFLRSAAGPSTERVRSLIDAIRRQVVTQADAAEFLRESEAPPSARSLRALERIARAAPRFPQAREALAWMLLKLGKYAEASTLFRGLLKQQLAQADRASVMLGLGCIAHAQQTGKDADVRLHAAVTAVASAPAAGANGAPAEPLPALSGAVPAARSSQLATGGAMFSGKLSEFALPDVIEFVRSARRTGLLVCSSEAGMAAVHFRAGRITGAESSGTPDVGELLVRARKISSVALRAVRTADQPDHVLAELLVRERMVEAAAVEEALRRRIELIVADLVRWKDGEFAFSREGEDESAGAAMPVEFDAQDVLLNVFRQMDEAARDRAGQALQP